MLEYSNFNYIKRISSMPTTVLHQGHEENECSLENTHGIDKKRLQLVEMGFPIDEITLAISRCGSYAN